MTTPAPSRGNRIPLSRLVVGILLHICVPAYLLACLFTAFLVDPPVAGIADTLPRMLWTGAWFVPAFLAVLAVSAGGAALLDRRAPAADPERAAREQLADARRALGVLGDRRIDRAMVRLDEIAWDWRAHEDRRVAADLDAAARTFAAAAASAAPGRRPDVLALAADSIERLAAAGEALAAARSRLDEGDARTVAGYLRARYGE